VPPQDVALGAFLLRSAIDRFPPGTIVVAVVDPGVGTPRRSVCGVRHGFYWIAPDNGLLGDVWAKPGEGELRAIDLEHLGMRATSRTFHGRDVFAPLAGNIASGRVGFTSVGPRIDDLVHLPPLDANLHRVIHVDTYGNLVTNVPFSAIARVRSVHVAGRSVPIRGTYGEAPKGSLLALVNSYDLLEIAENQGSAAATLGIGRGAAITLET
jgi:S-adenosyl-L-methionine hydrolase (adenosine-forming)